MKSHLFLFLFTLLSGFLSAQTTAPLTLDKAIDMGVKNSKVLQLSRARLEEATAAVKEAEQRKLPDVTATGSYLRVNNPTISLKYQQHMGGSSPDTSTHTASTPKVSQAAYGLVNASLPLFSGFRTKYGIEASKFLEKASVLDAVNDKEGVIINIIDSYNNLYKAGLQIDVINSSLQQSQQRVKDFTNLETNGLLARNDLLKAQLQVSNIQLTLVDAQNNVKLNAIVLNLLLGLPDSTKLSLDSSSFATLPPPGNAEDYIQQALQNRKDLQAVDYRIKAQGSAVKSAQGEKYPSIALTGGYVAANIPNVLSVYNAVNVGVGVQYSLSSLWKTDAKVAQARARERQAEANRGELSDQIQLQVGRSYLTYSSSLEKINVYQLAIEQAEENYRITKNKFDNSLATTTDLL
ncbi:MAG: TolC family protein, partial [Bacteroidota bacterium]|nr:TolC family protein [Bacteroidota bacterium]